MSRAHWNAVAGAIAALGAVICVYAVRQVDPDFWGYLDAGRLFATHGLTSRDPFAYTTSRSAWITFEYGAELVLWWAYEYGGPLGLLALKGALGGACLACVYCTLQATGARATHRLPLFLIAASGASRFFLFRPQLFTFALFAAFVLVLFRYLLGRPAPLWCLPLGALVWVNTHGGFVAGLAAIALAMGLATTVRRARPLALALVASAAATLVNPLGWRIWPYVWSELTHGTNRQYIREWSPATFHNDAWSTAVLILLAVSLAVVTAALWWYRPVPAEPRQGPPAMAWAMSAAPLLAMAFLSVRHTPLAAIWAAPVIAMLAEDVAGRLPSSPAFRRTWFALRGLAVVPVVLTAVVVAEIPGPGIRTDGFVLGRTHPCGAVEYLRAAGVKGHLYNPLWWGSYVTWNLYPSVQVAMDGRNITVFPDDMVKDNLRFYTRPASEVNPGLPLEYDTDLLLVPTDSPAIAPVRRDNRWHELYADQDAALFSRTDRTLAVADLSPRPPASACPAYFQ